jgi:putative tryptophan/tyrosine transport system substrate-binding protein
LKRRHLLALIAGAAVAEFPISEAAATAPTIGVLVVGAPSSQNFWRIFQEAMRELGYVEGKSVHFEFRSDEGDASRLGALAAELVQLKVDVIVAWFTPAATAAKQATSEIPIVMATAGDPVATGLVSSLARPGGNVTGTSAMAADLGGKCVELMREIIPSARRMAVLLNAPDPFSKPFLEKVRLAGHTTGTIIDPVTIEKSGDLDMGFAAMETGRPDAVIVQPSLPIKHVAELALRNRMPAASPFRPFAEVGGLLSYWFDEPLIAGPPRTSTRSSRVRSRPTCRWSCRSSSRPS